MMSDRNILAKYIQEVGNKIHDKQSQYPNHVFFFRGVNFNVKDVENVPKIFRKQYLNYFDNEDYIIREVMTNRPEYFRGCKRTIDVLEILQHYGFATRLMDVSRNYLVALYFACRSSGEKEDDDGVVFIYSLDYRKVKHSDSDIVSILANIALMPVSFRIKVIDGEYNQDLYYKKLLAQIRHEKPNFEDAIVWKHLNNYVVLVVPEKNNQRIVAQDGAFLLYGMINGCKQCEAQFWSKQDPYISCERVCVKKEDKKTILRQLSMMGINEASLFPELEKYAKSFDEKYLTVEKKGNGIL